jgi:hypothetical protein
VSREVRNLTVRLDAAHGGHRAVLKLYSRKCDEATRLAAMLEVTKESLDFALGCSEKHQQRRDRYEAAWSSASRRAGRRRAEIAELKDRHAEAQDSWRDTADALKVALVAAQREARAVPRPPSGAALELQDRAAMYRLEDENARLRGLLADLTKGRHGVPS